MSINRVPVYLAQMRDSAAKALEYVEGLNHAAFLDDTRTQQAVALNLMIVGEAATQLVQRRPDFVARHPEIAWASMTGMRNKIAHSYYQIDLNVVWDVVSDSLPELVGRLAVIDGEVAETT